MRIAEVRELLAKYSPEQLQVIIAEIYKSIPQAVKLDKDIDGIIKDPDCTQVSGRRKKTEKKPQDLSVMKMEIQTFAENAKAFYYTSPNSVVPKCERSKWRFKVKRWYKDLQSAAANRDNTAQAGALLEQLYDLLCYACDYIIFTTEDPFQSAGIPQAEFFRTILAVKRRVQDTKTFVQQAISLMMQNSLNHYSLREELMLVALEFIETPDAIHLAIQSCETGIEEEVANPTAPRDGWSDSGYRSKKIINDYVRMAFLCYNALHDIDKGIELFNLQYRETNPEIRLFVLTHILAGCNQPEVFQREFGKARKTGVKPRKELMKIYRAVKENGEF